MHQRIKVGLAVIALVSVFLLFSLRCDAQSGTSFKSPGDAVQKITRCTSRTCSEVAKQIGLSFPITLPCDVRTLIGPFEINADDVVLKVDCTGDFGLVLLREAGNGRWRYVNSVSFPQGDTYGNLKISTRRINSPAKKDMVVEHVIGMHGTGYLEDFFLVFRVVDGHLRTVLEVLDHYVRAGWPGVSDLDERATFTFDSPTSKQPGDIVERLVISAGELPQISLEQGFGWDSSSKMYAPDGWGDIKLEPRPQKTQ